MARDDADTAQFIHLVSTLAAEIRRNKYFLNCMPTSKSAARLAEAIGIPVPLIFPVPVKCFLNHDVDECTPYTETTCAEVYIPEMDSRERFAVEEWTVDPRGNGQGAVLTEGGVISASEIAANREALAKRLVELGQYYANQ